MQEKVDIKGQILNDLARHVLNHGLNTASLRPLAKAANTSDRMLIYYFGSKDALIVELLIFLSTDLASKLDNALPNARPPSVRACAMSIVHLIRKQPFRRYMRFWIEIVSAASHGSKDHREIGKKMVDNFLGWLSSKLPENTEQKDAAAAFILTLIDGTVVMDSVGKSAIADAAWDYAFCNDDLSTESVE